MCVTQDIVDHNSLILSDNSLRALDGNQILSVNTSRELLILLRVVKEAVVREVRPRRSQGQASAQCLPNCIIIATIITCSNYFAYDLIILAYDKVSDDGIKTVPQCNKKSVPAKLHNYSNNYLKGSHSRAALFCINTHLNIFFCV